VIVVDTTVVRVLMGLSSLFLSVKRSFPGATCFARVVGNINSGGNRLGGVLKQGIGDPWLCVYPSQKKNVVGADTHLNYFRGTKKGSV